MSGESESRIDDMGFEEEGTAKARRGRKAGTMEVFVRKRL
jgi:hypothetical protein